jgi:hypothetical protein
MNIVHPSESTELYAAIKTALRLPEDVQKITLTLSASGITKLDVERVPSYADLAAITKAIKGNDGTDNAN